MRALVISTLVGAGLVLSGCQTTGNNMGGVEYLPFKDQDLRIFLAYIGRKYVYTKAIPMLQDYNTNRVSLGVMYRIKAF